MSITELTRPYETLIRHHADGTVTAHHQQIYVLSKDGIVIAENILDPVSLSQVDLTSALGAATTAALGQNADLKAQIETLQTQVDSLSNQNRALQDALPVVET
ncbi:hypothetical protein [Aquirhabdus parva]|uniref:Uncharacterized protein n=1 Tax=Aquirhabdus parva TaxID=2283318 RepID=A0A345PAS6_9GAMM|nr:hypothetical protein [Aquirhabdus parva]AXI01439.1 hypothetical protein HYN46_00090 [Aquirhabdus parva]AXI04385.1 hypothetical protein HYN46_17005 [Aquirhabdus parva]